MPNGGQHDLPIRDFFGRVDVTEGRSGQEAELYWERAYKEAHRILTALGGHAFPLTAAAQPALISLGEAGPAVITFRYKRFVVHQVRRAEGAVTIRERRPAWGAGEYTLEIDAPGLPGPIVF